MEVLEETLAKAISECRFNLYLRQGCPRCEATRQTIETALDVLKIKVAAFEVIYIDANPELVWSQGIFAVPTLVKAYPEPERRLIGEIRGEGVDILDLL